MRTPKLIAYALATMAISLSCGKQPEPEPTPTPTPKPEEPDTPAVVTPAEPVKVQLIQGNIHQMTYTYDAGTDTYSISTSGDDAYVFTSQFRSKIDETPVLTFEYTATKAVDDFQIYYCEPLAEGRSGHFGTMPKSSSWKEFNCNLKTDMAKHSWGRTGDYMRVDFGHVANNNIQIRGLKLRPMNDAEKAEYDKQTSAATGNAAMAERLGDYLKKNYSSEVTSVSVKASEIVISGKAAGSSGYYLAEIAPYEDITETKTFSSKTPIPSPTFSITVPRTASRGGFTYDKILSKWAVVKGDEIDSHARYADEIEISSYPEKAAPKTKKGLGGFYGPTLQISDLDALGITSVTVNIVLNTLINTTVTGAYSIPYKYGGKTYYINASEQSAQDKIMAECAKRGIVVSVILLTRPGDNTAATAIMKHPENQGGNYSMQNLTTPEGVNIFAGAIDYLASRYNGGSKGRIHHWIIHNEVDFGTEWTNMGDQPELRFIDTYIKVMRVCGLIARKYDPNGSPLISLTHCWSRADGQYAPKSLLEDLNNFSAAEGDFYWGVAYHPYPQDLTKPAFWNNDTRSTYDENSSYCTFKNLEVVDHWIRQKKNMYKGSTKRLLFLSENGTNSPSYSESDLALQAAGAAWALKKVYALEGIDAIQWHNWMDNRYEGGLRIGLRKFSDEPGDPAGIKPVWHVYQAAGTSSESAVFDPYLKTIGINSWEETLHKF